MNGIDDFEKILDDAFGMGKNYPEDYKVLKAGMLKKAKSILEIAEVKARMDELETAYTAHPGIDTEYLDPRLQTLDTKLKELNDGR